MVSQACPQLPGERGPIPKVVHISWLQAEDVGSGWDSTGGVPPDLSPRGVRGAVLVEWMLPGAHGSADPGRE